MTLSATKKDLVRIGLPAVSGFLGVMVYQLVDMFWIAKLGTEAVAGVAASEYWLWAIEAVMGITTIGCATLISQHLGAKDEDGARRVAQEAAHLSIIVAVAIVLCFYPSGSALLKWMGLSPEAHRAGWTYLSHLIFAMPLVYLALLGTQVFNAHGDTKTAVCLLTVGLIVNAVLDPLLIFGLWGFPKLGVAGAAWATIIGWTVGFVLRWVYLRKRNFVPPLADFIHVRTDFWRRIMKIGAPTATSHLVWTSVYPLLTTLITAFGMVPLAGMTIAHRFESVAYFTCLGFSIATATLVGRAVGAGDIDKARAVAEEARTLITWLLLPLAALFICVPEVFIRIMSDDPGVIAAGASYLRTIGYFEVFLGWELIYEGGFSGLGSTRRYMYVSVPLTLGRYPAAYFLIVTMDLPVDAIWWCITVSTLSKGLLLSWIFRRTQAEDLGVLRPTL